MKRVTPRTCWHRGRQALAATLLVAAVVGCSRQTPAPVEYKGTVERPTETTTTSSAEARTTANPPRPVQKPSERTQARRSSKVAAIEVEPAQPPDRPREEATPARPAVDQIVVARGDSLYAIARRHKASIRAVIVANGLEPPYVLKVGQRLRLPPSRTYVVRPGDTVYAVSRRFVIDMGTLVRINGLTPPYVIAVGQRLHIPGAAAAETPPPPRGNRVAVIVDPDAPPPPRAGGTFVWPVEGRLISEFGPKPGGLHNDGVNIATDLGVVVHAAENGIVAYAGNELRGFGNLVLIRHADGWVTAYAHNDALLVARGEQVRRGQAIARVGATGGVERPQLHFEVRKGIRAVDPLLYLSKSQASLVSVEPNA